MIIKARSLRRTDSGGLIRVISATPRPPAGAQTQHEISADEIGINSLFLFIECNAEFNFRMDCICTS